MRCKVIKNARKSTLFLLKNQQKGLEMGEVMCLMPSFIALMEEVHYIIL